jgi:OFA family oxalate/formate antiporter-like MFS transporter
MLTNNLHQESSLSYYGWLVVAMAFLANLIAFGLVYAFSVFFKPLASEFGWSRATTAAAFSVYAISHDVFAPVTGWLTDRFGPKLTAAMGGLCLASSMVLMSRITSIWEVYLYYALLFGLGIAAIYAPMMATVSRWFTIKRGLAIGLTAAGLGVGSLVLSPLAAWLISSCGWRTAYVCVGVMAFAIFIPITVLIKRAPSKSLGVEGEGEPSKGFSFGEALRTRTFWIFSLSWLFIALALWAIMVHIVPLLTDREIPLTVAGFLAGLIGGGSLIGRIGAGFLSDRLGRKLILLTSYIFQLMMLIWLLFSTEIWMFYIFAPLFGISFGGWAGVIAAFPADYFGSRATGAIFGFSMIIVGIGGAIGPYVGGYIFDITHSYGYAIGMSILATFVGIVLASLLKPPAKVGF